MNSDEWLSQRHCQVCFHNPDGPAPDRKLNECPTCHCAAHCASPECTTAFQKIHTAQACESYMIGLAALVIMMQGGGQAVQNTRTREPSLRVPADWSEFFTRKINDMDCHPAFMRMPPMMVGSTLIRRFCSRVTDFSLFLFSAGDGDRLPLPADDYSPLAAPGAR